MGTGACAWVANKPLKHIWCVRGFDSRHHGHLDIQADGGVWEKEARILVLGWTMRERRRYYVSVSPHPGVGGLCLGSWRRCTPVNRVLALEWALHAHQLSWEQQQYTDELHLTSPVDFAQTDCKLESGLHHPK